MIPRSVDSFLTRHASLYAKLLRWTGRGSLEKRLFLSLVHRDAVVCDIGANRGNFTLLFSNLVGRDGEVHAFEPVPATFAILQKVMADHGARRNCRLNNLALGETPGVVTLHQPGADDGQASLRIHEHGSWVNSVPVLVHNCRVTTLDEYTRSFRRLDFIKCDVEGAEMLVFKGARATLDRFSPVLFVEVFEEWTKAFAYQPAELLALLVDAGYQTFFLVDRAVTRIERDHVINGPANLLCGKPGDLPDVLEA